MLSVSASNLETHLRYLCDTIGTRLAGTRAEALGAEYLAAHVARLKSQSVHNVVVGKGKVKAHRMGLPLRTYYDRLDQAHKRYSGASHALHKNDGIRAVREAA